MLTSEQLAERLRAVCAQDLARETGVSPKTIYRLRRQCNSPTLDTLQKLLDGMRRLEKRRPRAA